MIKIVPVERTMKIIGSVEEINEYNSTLMQDETLDDHRVYICTNCRTQVGKSDSISRAGNNLICLHCQFKMAKILGVSRLDILNLVQRNAKEIKCEQNMNKIFVDNPYQE